MNREIKELHNIADLHQHEVNKIIKQLDYRFRKHEAELFRSEGSAGGAKWAALSPAYAAWKSGARSFQRSINKSRKAAGKKSQGAIGSKILTLRGTLKKSLTQTKNANPQHIAFGGVQPRPFFTFGTRNRLAAYHGRGRFHNMRLPVRDALQHRSDDVQKYYDIIKDYWLEVKWPNAIRRMQRTGARIKVAQAL